MFQDIKVSDDLNSKFLDYLKSEAPTPGQTHTMTSLIGLDFSIYVLQVSFILRNCVPFIVSLSRLIPGQLLSRLRTRF